MGNNFVYVLLAVRNGEKYIQQAIQSVLNQTYQNFKLIVVLNGCTDKTLNIVRFLNSDISNRKMINVSMDSTGKSIALNAVLDTHKWDIPSIHPKPDWFAIQDADDIWHPTKLEEQLKYANAYDVIGTDCHYIGADGNHLDINPRPKAFLHDKIVEDAFNGHNPIVNCSALIRANLLEKFNYNPELDGIEDYDLWMRIMRYTDSKFINIPQKLVDHRLHPESHFNTKNFTEKINQLIQTYKQK